jgi:GTP-binding protein YchF
MPLQIGIIGLPNVGKSTVFNVLTQTQKAAVENYPFCTIEPNLAVVPVLDPRLEKIGQLVNVDQVIHTTVEFLDIAGLVKGASKGEGLGNQFLGTIRNTDALLHIVRCFEDPNVVHVSEFPQPKIDIETIQLELILADLQQLDRKIEKLTSQAKGDKTIQSSLDLAADMKDHLESGQPLSIYVNQENPAFQLLNKEMRFLSAKPVIYGVNIGEEYLDEVHPDLAVIQEIAAAENAALIQISAKLESELNQLTDSDRVEYMDMAGITDRGLDKIIQAGYKTLNLISFFTYNDQEARAWTVNHGAKAPQAAGKIHTDFEKGFIKAEVIPFEVFELYGSTGAAKEAGKLQIEGRDYIIKDGDVIYFRFNL